MRISERGVRRARRPVTRPASQPAPASPRTASPRRADLGHRHVVLRNVTECHQRTSASASCSACDVDCAFSSAGPSTRRAAKQKQKQKQKKEKEKEKEKQNGTHGDAEPFSKKRRRRYATHVTTPCDHAQSLTRGHLFSLTSDLTLTSPPRSSHGTSSGPRDVM